MTDTQTPQLTDEQFATVKGNFELLLTKLNMDELGRFDAQDSFYSLSTREARYATVAQRRTSRRDMVSVHTSIDRARQFLSDIYDDEEASYVVDLLDGTTYTVYVELHVGETIDSILS